MKTAAQSGCETVARIVRPVVSQRWLRKRGRTPIASPRNGGVAQANVWLSSNDEWQRTTQRYRGEGIVVFTAQ
jgi:hypothetical protein